ncbi:Low-density lipoprotein receptor domain class A [Branchiostoma belcheri]|nr:Low-density lipoprotein receptor domain class A [Branchiostoma belcheri]
MASSLLLLACLLYIGSAPSAATEGQCPSDSFKCSTTDDCISLGYLCDFDADCPDGSDEDYCSAPGCLQSPHVFGCKSNDICITLEYVCDEEDDCDDGSDEANCTSAECLSSSFLLQCETSGRCIPQSWQCDGEDDCDDGSDEVDCEEKACPVSNQFRCEGEGVCIDPMSQCDGQDDCEDGSDEVDCTTKDCHISDHFKCEDSGICIPPYQQCNGWANCDDGSDEVNCTGKECHHLNYFKCKTSGICRHPQNQCNGWTDCDDGSDEVNCTNKECHHLNYFKCKTSGICLHPLNQCNGRADCDDGSDEVNCTSRECHHLNYFKCKTSGICLHPLNQCNGRADCDDGSDEVNCTTCSSPGRFLCKRSATCIRPQRQCDGINDCPYGEDEERCDCPQGMFQCERSALPDSLSPHACIHDVTMSKCGLEDCPGASDQSGVDCVLGISRIDGWEFRECSNETEFTCETTGICVPWSRVCDGVEDCGDGSEETCGAEPQPAPCYLGTAEFRCATGNTCVPFLILLRFSDVCPVRFSPECTSAEFRCARSGRCVEPARVCDDVTDCDDASDELPCLSCDLRGLWQCDSGECINATSVCDGDSDCISGTDEDNCHTPCHGLQFACGGTCLPKYRVCDGMEDCSDGEDEQSCADCGVNQFLCPDGNGTCLLESQLCNSQPDCSGGEDEEDCGGDTPPGFPLGLASRYIPDTFVTASSQYKPDFAPFQARFTHPATPRHCWVPSSVRGEWLQGNSDWFTLPCSTGVAAIDAFPVLQCNLKPANIALRKADHLPPYRSVLGEPLRFFGGDVDQSQILGQDFRPAGAGGSPRSLPPSGLGAEVQDSPCGVVGWESYDMSVPADSAHRCHTGSRRLLGPLPELDARQVYFGKTTNVTGVVVGGGCSNWDLGSWVTSFTLAFSMDGATWRPYGGSGRALESLGRGGGGFPLSEGPASDVGARRALKARGNRDRYRRVSRPLQDPVTSRYIRLYPENYEVWVAMVMEVYVTNGLLEGIEDEGHMIGMSGLEPETSWFLVEHCRYNTPHDPMLSASCLNQDLIVDLFADEDTWLKQGEYTPLGVGVHPGDVPAKISDSALRASSRDGEFFPRHARLNNGQGQQQGACWSPAPGLDTDQWLQIKHDKVHKVVGVVTQGAYNLERWVTSYTLAFSVGGLTWTPATDGGSGEGELVIQGNTDSHRYSRHLLDKPMYALYTRFYPRTFHNRIALRVEILVTPGCASDEILCDQTCRARADLCRLFDGCVPLDYHFGDEPVCEDILHTECGEEETTAADKLGCSEIDSQFSLCEDDVSAVVSREPERYHASQACDGREDCSTGKDEATCEGCALECAADRSCIPSTWICDDIEDCSDGTDERACVEGVPKNCFFHCVGNMTCLPTRLLGDGHRDCADGGDERDSDIEEALARRWGSCGYTCASVYGNASCVPYKFFCDGSAGDCPTLTCGRPGAPAPYCVPVHLICDGHPDCVSGEDEQGCGGQQAETSPAPVSSTPGALQQDTAEPSAGLETPFGPTELNKQSRGTQEQAMFWSTVVALGVQMLYRLLSF